MSASHFLRWFVLLGSFFILSACERKAGSGRLEKFRPAEEDSLEVQTIETPGQFSGYTNYWHSIFWVWHSYGNLYQISHADVARSILQNKVDIAEELGVPGLALQEGFLSLLIGSSFVELEDTSEDVLSRALKPWVGRVPFLWFSGGTLARKGPWPLWIFPQLSQSTACSTDSPLRLSIRSPFTISLLSALFQLSSRLTKPTIQREWFIRPSLRLTSRRENLPS